jgi:hypothetical protein
MELRRGGKQLEIIEAIRDRLGVSNLLTRFSSSIYNKVIEMVESNKQWQEHLDYYYAPSTWPHHGSLNMVVVFNELLDSEAEARIEFYPTNGVSAIGDTDYEGMVKGFGCRVRFTWKDGTYGTYDRVALEYLGDFIDPIDMVATVGDILEEHPVEFYGELSEHQHIKIGNRLPEYWNVVKVRLGFPEEF